MLKLCGSNHHEVAGTKGKIPTADGETGCATRQVCHLKTFVKMRIKGPFPIAVDVVSLAGNGILFLMCQHGNASMEHSANIIAQTVPKCNLFP